MIFVCEIFKSIQGESTYAGQICSFVRLSGCNLRCSYCDTSYAWNNGHFMEIDKIIDEITFFDTSLVEITGGEPLLQKETSLLCDTLLAKGYTVLIETNGSLDISLISDQCHRIVDVKCPDSKEGNSFLQKNISILSKKDEVKFVISSKTDFDWAIDFVKHHGLTDRCPVLFSPNMQKITPRDCAEWILKSDLNIRLGLQLHKFIWPPSMRGV